MDYEKMSVRQQGYLLEAEAEKWDETGFEMVTEGSTVAEDQAAWHLQVELVSVIANLSKALSAALLAYDTITE